MSREASRTATKSKMELSATKYNLQSTVVNLGHRKSLHRLYGSPRYTQMFLKDMLNVFCLMFFT